MKITVEFDLDSEQEEEFRDWLDNDCPWTYSDFQIEAE